jgi:hypothetical protein
MRKLMLSTVTAVVSARARCSRWCEGTPPRISRRADDQILLQPADDVMIATGKGSPHLPIRQVDSSSGSHRRSRARWRFHSGSKEAAAQSFIGFLTSPEEQAKVKGFTIH